ncbi:MAG: ATP-binding protein [Oscillospiraceae bacterium]|nr:ATP-binding protein [Oscillospiraceae bacterium]
MTVPKRIASNLINALKGGVVPRTGLGYIAVGRTAEINALLHDVEITEQGGAFFRFIVGRYGSGKSFLLQTVRQHVMDRGFVTADADLSPERRLMGSKGQGLATYRELMRNLSVKTKPDGGALSLILEKWITSVRNEVIEEGTAPSDIFYDTAVEKKIYVKISELQDMVHGFDFAKVINAYHKAYSMGEEEKTACVIKWLRGEYATKTEAKNDLGVNVIITDENWYDYIKILTAFFVKAGYKGFVLMIDELVNIMKIPHSVTRQYNYEKILMMYNDVLQGKATHLGIIMGGTPQCIEDPRRGVFSYEALRSRLERGRFATDDVHDLLAPIIKLQPLSYEELTVLTEKLTEIHAGLYGYESRVTLEDRIYFIKAEFGRVGADVNITPREMIRDFIELLNMAMQNPDKTLPQLMGEESFSFAESEEEKADISGFEDFEL